jgi:uncharacterized OB-fold protein
MNGVLPAELVVLQPDPWTEPYWRATAAHRLVVPRCTRCATYRFPPTPFCFNCRAQEVEWVEQSGEGEIYSFTIIRHAVIPQVADALPLIAAVVELPGTGGCRIVGNVVDAAPDAVAIGLPVRVDWYDVATDTTVPVFRLV